MKSIESMESIDKTAKSIGAFDSINYGVYYSTKNVIWRPCGGRLGHDSLALP